MADKQGESSTDFLAQNLHTIPKFNNAFIAKFASDHLPIKTTLTRGYKIFHKSRTATDLMKYRQIASNFKQVCFRRKDHEMLSARLLNSKFVQTAAMTYGIEHKEEAAWQYSQQFGRNVFPMGFVINPSLPLLSCSPDRRVCDATENPSWGLLEIKCSMSDYLSGLKFLKVNERSGTHSLRKTHCSLLSSHGL